MLKYIVLLVTALVTFTTNVLGQSVTDYKIEGDLFCGRIKVSDSSSHIGYIDSLGRLIVPCLYHADKFEPLQNSSTDFSEGYAKVVTFDSIQYTCNWVNTKGKLFNTSGFKYCNIFWNGVSWCVDKNKRIYDAILVNDSISIYSRGDKRFISNEIYYKPSDTVSIDPQRYLFRCKLYTLKDSLIGEFVTAVHLSESGLIQVYDCASGKWGLIDSKGSFVLDYVSDDSFWIHDGIILMKNDGNWHVFNRKSKKFYPSVYKSCNLSGYFICQDMAGKYDVFDYNGILLKGLTNCPKIGCIKDKLTQKYGFFDETGKVIDFIYDNYINFNKEGYALVRRGGKASVIDRKGRVIIRER